MRIWDVSRFPVVSVDMRSQTMRFHKPVDISSEGRVLSHWRGDRRYYLENSISFLTAPGEWFLDRKKGVLSLRPLAEHKTRDVTVVAPAVDRLMRFKGRKGKPVRHIRFEGLRFSHSAWSIPGKYYDGHQADVEVGAAIEGDYVKRVEFSRCAFSGLGRYALWFREGCAENRVRECEFFDLGAGAVLVGENKKGNVRLAEETVGNVIADNHIHHCGRVWHGSVGVWVGAASRTLIARNHIHDLPYSGISVGWTWKALPSPCHHNTIERNHIHDVMLGMSDGGGIYTLGLQPGTVIRNNVIHDSPGWQPRSWANGIYMDQGSSEMLIENNLVCRVGRWGLVIGMGERNIIRNNIFALAGSAMLYIVKGRDNRFERNVVLVEYRMFENNFEPKVIRMDYNLYYHVEGESELEFKGKRLAEWRKITRGDAHSVVADPRFKDVKNGDFSLRRGSPALEIGFKPFELPAVGPPKRPRRAPRIHPGPMERKDPPRLVAAPPSSKIVIDGRASEKAWKDIKPVPLRRSPYGAIESKVRHRARVACDGRVLYVLLESDFPDMSRLRAVGDEWGRHDGAEICFQWVSADKWTPVFVVRGFASGQLSTATEMGADRTAERRLRKGVKFAARVGENRWVGEWKIPLLSLGVDLRKKNELRFNIGVRRAAERKWAAWVGTGSENFYVANAGLLVVEVPKAAGGRRRRRR